MILSTSKFYATEQSNGRQDDENRWIGLANGAWMGVLIWVLIGISFAAILWGRG